MGIDVNAKSSLPPHMLKSGNIGKVMNSPRIGAPEDKSNDISNMSEFAESAPVEQEKDIRTWEERLNSKKWKDRQAAYRELYDLFQSVKEKPEDPIFEKYQSFVNGCAKDKFAACVVDGLKVCDAFVNYSTLVHNGTFELEEMLNATINNFGQKSSVVNTATELVLSMLKVKKEKDTIVSALVNGAFHKKVKVSSNSVTVLIKVVQYFGIPTIPLTPIQEGMKKMLESKHAVTRKESVKFVQTGRRADAQRAEQEQLILRRVDPEQHQVVGLRHPAQGSQDVDHLRRQLHRHPGALQACRRAVHGHVPSQGLPSLVHRRGHGRDGVHGGRVQHERSCLRVPAVPGRDRRGGWRIRGGGGRGGRLDAHSCFFFS